MCELKPIMNVFEVFADKCMNILNKINVKYNLVIDSEDKQELNELRDEFKCILSKLFDNKQKNRENNSNESISETNGQTIESNEELNERTVLMNCVEPNETPVPEESDQLSEENVNKRENKSKKIIVKKVVKRHEFLPTIVNSVTNKVVIVSPKEDRKTKDQMVQTDGSKRTRYESRKYYKDLRDKCFDVINESFECPKRNCDKSYKHLKHLTKHLREYHNSQREDIRRKHTERLIRMEAIHCLDLKTSRYVCPKDDCISPSFATKDEMVGHLRAHQLRTGRKLICNYPNCGKAFNDRSSLKSHRKRHIDCRPFECAVGQCTYRGRDKHSLNEHMKSHSDLKPFKCDFNDCDRDFKSSQALRTHRLGAHTSEPTIKCRFEGCIEMFKTKNIRITHEIKKHERQPYVKNKIECDWPGCEFKGEASQVRSHKNVHTNSRPFPCEWPGCEYSAKRSATLNKHMKTHK